MTKISIQGIGSYSSSAATMNHGGAYNTSMQPERMAGRVGLSTLSGDEVQFSGRTATSKTQSNATSTSNGLMGIFQGAFRQLATR